MFRNQALKMKENKKLNYREIIELVPPAMRNSFNSKNDAFRHIKNQLERYERYQKKMKNLLFWSKTIITIGLFVIPMICFYWMTDSGSSIKMIIGVSAFVFLLLVWFVQTYTSKNIERYRLFIERSEYVLKTFCEAAEMLIPKQNGEAVGVVKRVMSAPIIEKNLENGAFNIVCWQGKVLELCERRIKGEGASLAELVSACDTLADFEMRFDEIWNASQIFGINDRSKKSYFDQARSLRDVKNRK